MAVPEDTGPDHLIDLLSRFVALESVTHGGQ